MPTCFCAFWNVSGRLFPKVALMRGLTGDKEKGIDKQ